MSLAQVRVDGSGGYGPSELPAAASPADCGPTVVSVADIPVEHGGSLVPTIALAVFVFAVVAIFIYLVVKGDR